MIFHKCVKLHNFMIMRADQKIQYNLFLEYHYRVLINVLIRMYSSFVTMYAIGK